jgi:hypothetical protein
MRLLSMLLVLCTSVAIAADDPWKLDEKFKAAKPEDLKDAESTPAPKGAIVLFDGKDFSNWLKRDGKSEVKWTLRDGGVMEGVKGHGDIITKEKFEGKFKLHVEFRVPYEPNGKGQDRGNSGVYIQGRYEVQILDSYGLKSENNDCGAIYGVAAPKVNMCKAPTVWQAYNIIFASPKFENGKKTEPPHVTVYQNGMIIHQDVTIPVDNTTAGMGGDPSTPGPIMLQDHGHPVQFRNIWLLPMKND